MNKIETKNTLRQNAKAIRNGFGKDYIKKASQLVCEKLSSTTEFQNADVILMYYPIKNELSPLSLFKLAKEMGKTLAFPLCNTENNTLSFKTISNPQSPRVFLSAVLPICETNLVCPIEIYFLFFGVQTEKRCKYS